MEKLKIIELDSEKLNKQKLGFFFFRTVGTVSFLLKSIKELQSLGASKENKHAHFENSTACKQFNG